MNYFLHHLTEVDSTNTHCKKLARENAPHGTVVIADHQTGGRGRMGRTFCSPRTGLYCSVLLRPSWDADTVQLVTACTAVAAAEAVDALCGAHTGIKWVNDLFLGNRKIAGILTEAAFTASGQLDYLIVGIGINLRDTHHMLPEELHAVATSIEEETGCIITPMQMADVLLKHLDEAYAALPEKRFLEAYRARSVLIGKDVMVHAGTGSYPAHVIGIDDTAGLMVQLPDGTHRVLNTGEVSVRLK